MRSIYIERSYVPALAIVSLISQSGPSSSKYPQNNKQKPIKVNLQFSGKIKLQKKLNEPTKEVILNNKEQ